MNKLEQRTAASLAAVYSVRMLGLFMILPVLPLYAKSQESLTPLLIGFAIAIYGLMQASLQIPLGLLSDKIGRKPVILGGLLVFVVGSLVAAMAGDNFYLLIIGRAIQGMGAIASATMALAADLTREEHRAKVMATIGMTIGIAFAVAMVVGPIIDANLGISGIFWITALLAIAGILLIIFVVPTPAIIEKTETGIISNYLQPILQNNSLLKVNFSVFILHLIMTANFTIIPLILRDDLGMESISHWKVYLPILLIAFILSVPQIIIAEKYRKMKPLFLIAIMTIAGSQLILGFWHDSFYLMIFALLIFFIGFSFLEAILPSLVAKYTKPNTKGTAMGVFSTAQFAGIFSGGMLGGWIGTEFGESSVLLLGAVLSVVWLWVIIRLKMPVLVEKKS